MIDVVLAQVPQTTSAQIGIWLVTAAAVVVIANQIFSFWKTHMKEQPPPAETYMTKAACHEMHHHATTKVHEIEARLAKIHESGEERVSGVYERIESLRKEVKTDILGVHNRVNEVLEAVAELRGEVKGGLKNHHG